MFRVDAANRLWFTDITEHWTSERKLYSCAIKGVFSNRIVGYSISERMTAKLAVDAVHNAVARRCEVAGGILRTDRGRQFRSRAMAPNYAATIWSDRWAASVPPGTKRPWSHSDRYCSRTCSTSSGGLHGRSCGWPSSCGPSESTTANALRTASAA